MKSALSAVLFCLLLSACASGPTAVPPSSPSASKGSSAGATPAVTTPPPVRTSPDVQPTPRPSAPVDNMIAEAQRYRDTGDLASSFARLERALRIAPQRAEIYLELARNYAAQGNDNRAAASAERGLLYCTGALCRELRRFIDR